jgi:hypothetical protein
MRRVSNFDTFIKGRQQSNNLPVNEGLLSWLKDNVISKLTGWAKSFYDKLKNGEIPAIPAGQPYAGKPSVMLYLPENGPIDKQIEAVYGGGSETNEARIGLEYPNSAHEVRDVYAEELQRMIKRLYLSKQKGGRAKPIFIYGAPGIGKTQIVGSVAKELGLPMMDFKNLDVQFMNPEDFAGVPSQHNVEDPSFQEVDGKRIMTSPGRGYTRFNAPVTLPTDNGKDGKGGFIFLDEMNRAQETVLNKLMQFVQMGRLPDYQLPDKWIIIAAGNRPEEADVAEFDSALADRFTIINYVPVIKTWAEWALETENILPELPLWMQEKDNEKYFHNLDKDKGALNYPTPRSWTDAALTLRDEIEFSGAQSWRDIPQTEILNIFLDSVGSEAAGKFSGYLEILRQMSERDLQEIAINPAGAKKITDTKKSTLRGTALAVIRKVDDYDDQKLYNIVEYFSQYGQAEILTWIYAAIRKKFPEFGVITKPEVPGHEIRLAASKLITSATK